MLGTSLCRTWGDLPGWADRTRVGDGRRVTVSEGTNERGPTGAPTRATGRAGRATGLQWLMTGFGPEYSGDGAPLWCRPSAVRMDRRAGASGAAARGRSGQQETEQ